MIDFTKKAVLVKNSKILTELKSSLYAEFNKARTGIHVSDLNLCMREVVFRSIDPKPLEDRDINVFTSGRAVHDAIQTIAKRYSDKYITEKEVNFDPTKHEVTKDIFGAEKVKILAHIDLYDTINNIPYEFKSARKEKLGTYNRKTRQWGAEEAKPFNVEQLMMYMCLVDSDIGYLVYQMMLDFKNFPFKVFEVTMTKEEREDMLAQMVFDAVHLDNNLKEKTPENTRHIAEDETKNWKCSYCKYLNECIELRNKEFIQIRKANVIYTTEKMGEEYSF